MFNVINHEFQSDKFLSPDKGKYFKKAVYTYLLRSVDPIAIGKIKINRL